MERVTRLLAGTLSAALVRMPDRNLVCGAALPQYVGRSGCVDTRVIGKLSRIKGDVQMKLFRFGAGATLALILGSSCFGQDYTQTNLVSNTAGVAPVTDPQLINPWGLSRASGSPWWISDEAAGLSTLYNGPGAKQSLVVTIPPADPSNKNTPLGTPTGTIANGSQTDFLLAPGKPAAFLFSTITEPLPRGIRPSL